MNEWQKKYPDLRLDLSGLSMRILGAQGPSDDPLLARTLQCEVSDECYWRNQGWFVPLQPKAMDMFAKHIGIPIPPEVAEVMDFLRRNEQARAKANVWRELDDTAKRAWLEKIGVKFKIEPYAHQVTSIGYALQLPLCALLLDTGTGKTGIASVVMQVLKNRGGGPFLVVAPKTLLREAWGADIEKFTDLRWLDIGDPPAPEPMTVCPKCQRDFKSKPVPKQHMATHMRKQLNEAKARVDLDAVAEAVLDAFKSTGNKDADTELLAKQTKDAQTEALRKAQEPIWDRLYTAFPALRALGSIDHEERIRKALERTDIDVYVINPERAKPACEILKARKFSALIVDESSMMRAHASQTTEALIDIGWTTRRRIAMSGTPRPNSNLELWGQYAMLDAAFGHDYHVFKEKYFQVDWSGYRWNLRPGLDKKFSEIIAERSLRYRLEDCVDLPGETTETHEVELNDELREHYKTMLKEMLVEIDENKKVSTAYKLVQVNKLAQITSGFIYDADGNVNYLSDRNPKLQETIRVARDLVEDEGRSVVIWITFSDVESTAIKTALKKFGVSVIVGGMSSDQISKNVRDFKEGRHKIMVAHPASAKFGHTWVNATAAIYHSYNYSWENYYQSKHRIYRIGQKNKVTYINIVARKTVDKVIMAALLNKEADSELVIDGAFINALRGTL